MWECEICGHLNEDELEICEARAALRDESSYDNIDDEYLDEEEGLLCPRRQNIFSVIIVKNYDLFRKALD